MGTSGASSSCRPRTAVELSCRICHRREAAARSVTLNHSVLCPVWRADCRPSSPLSDHDPPTAPKAAPIPPGMPNLGRPNHDRYTTTDGANAFGVLIDNGDAQPERIRQEPE